MAKHWIYPCIKVDYLWKMLTPLAIDCVLNSDVTASKKKTFDKRNFREAPLSGLKGIWVNACSTRCAYYEGNQWIIMDVAILSVDETFHQVMLEDQSGNLCFGLKTLREAILLAYCNLGKMRIATETPFLLHTMMHVFQCHLIFVCSKVDFLQHNSKVWVTFSGGDIAFANVLLLCQVVKHSHPRSGWKIRSFWYKQLPGMLSWSGFEV